MKIVSEEISIETSGVKKAKAFGIADMGMVLEILRSKLYADPIAAICREITCNARDAHREVGKADVPIKIVLPTQLDPHFRVIDFGPGISEQRMENVFIQFAASTKRDTNEMTGGFGLGAKTPFAYSDQFNIITVVNGIKRSYSAYIDETKVGQIALLHERQTDEPNGTQIMVPVKESDFSKFAEEVERATRWWDVQPLVNGSFKSKRPSDDQLIMKGADWAIYKSRGHSYYGEEAVLLIDGIAYKFNDQMTRRGYDDTSYRAMLFGGNKRLVVNFPNGLLSLAANRESVHWDERSTKIVEERLEAIAEEIRERLQGEVESCGNYIDACDKAVSLTNAFNVPLGMEGAFTWGGVKVLTSWNGGYQCNWSVLNVRRAKDVDGNPIEVTHEYVTREKGRASVFTPEHKTVVVINDIGISMLSPKRAAEIFNAVPENITQILVMPEADFNKDGMKHFHPYITSVKLSDFAKAPNGKALLRKKRRLVYVRTGCEFTLSSIATFEENKGTKLYVLLQRQDYDKRLRPVLDKAISRYDVDEVLSNITREFNVTIYGFEKAQFEEDPDAYADLTEDAVLFDDFVKETALAGVDVEDLYAFVHARKEHPINNYSKFEGEWADLNKYTEDDRFDRIQTLRKFVAEKNEKWKTLRHYALLIHKDLPSRNLSAPKEYVELSSLINGVSKDYPLLRHMFENCRWPDDSLLRDLAGYINLKYRADNNV